MIPSYTLVTAQGSQYISLVVDTAYLEKSTDAQLGKLIREQIKRLADDQEPTSHISHARRFLEEQAELNG